MAAVLCSQKVVSPPASDGCFLWYPSPPPTRMRRTDIKRRMGRIVMLIVRPMVVDRPVRRSLHNESPVLGI